MSEHDEPESKPSRRKGRRRSLRVPVDEVPRPTQGGDSSPLAVDGGATIEMPAFDDEQRAPLEAVGRSGTLGAPIAEIGAEPVEELVELTLQEEPELDEEPELAISEAPPALDDEDGNAGADEEEGGAPQERTTSTRLEAQALGGAAEPRVRVSPTAALSIEVQVDDDSTGSSDEVQPVLVSVAKADGGAQRSVTPIMGVVVQRVVSIVSGPPSPARSADSVRPADHESRADDSTTKGEEEAPGEGSHRGDGAKREESGTGEAELPDGAGSGAHLEATELAVDIEDDDQPELRVREPDAGELDELDVDLEEGGQQASAAEVPAAAVPAAEVPAAAVPAAAVPAAAAPAAAAPAAAAPAERRDSAPELTSEEAEEILEFEEALARAEAKKRPSKPPPPPPANKAKDAAAQPGAEPPPAAEPAKPAPAMRRKKSRRNWWEELFNDDYLRTVPIPHPRVISTQCDFIERRLGLGQGATILDVGCGLGLHAVELTRRGYLVVGLDLSLPMLSRAADEAQDCGFKINFLHADMREMNFDGAFDAVLCYGTTFGYFDDEGNKQVVDRLHRALKPRGLLLLDVVNRDFVIRYQPNLVWFEGDGCVVMEESQMNYFTSRLEVKRTVILDDGRQKDNLYSVRAYSLHELGQILHHQGFRVVEVTGWEAHPGVFFGGDSPKLIILAERRPAGPPTPPGRTSPGDLVAGEDPGSEPPTLEVGREPPSAEEVSASPAGEAAVEPVESSGEADGDAPSLSLEPEEDGEDLELAEEDLVEPEN